MAQCLVSEVWQGSAGLCAFQGVACGCLVGGEVGSGVSVGGASVSGAVVAVSMGGGGSVGAAVAVDNGALSSATTSDMMA